MAFKLYLMCKIHLKDNKARVDQPEEIYIVCHLFDPYN